MIVRKDAIHVLDSKSTHVTHLLFAITESHMKDNNTLMIPNMSCVQMDHK